MKSKLLRRDVVRTVSASLVAVPFVGCGDDDGRIGDAGLVRDAGSLEDGGGGLDTGLLADGGVSADGGAGSGWASGGTAAMVDAASYPDPFVAASACALFADSTLGPCYTNAPLRQDVSEGYPGLPVRLALQVLDADCNPLEGARVDIWHTRNSGLYSEGPIDLCTTGDADAAANTYFRGAQVTNAEGKLGFDTCFPGWYGGRAIHIHFQVFLADETTATKISQLFFPPALIREVFASHVDYASFGQPDTPNAADGIYRGVGESGIVEHQRMSDGAMLAWKQIRVV